MEVVFGNDDSKPYVLGLCLLPTDGTCICRLVCLVHETENELNHFWSVSLNCLVAFFCGSVRPVVRHVYTD